jgi:4-hydroxy-2-oxoheptanedioate aldolase
MTKLWFFGSASMPQLILEVLVTSSSRHRPNRLRGLLETKSLVRGPFISLSDPTVIDLAALAGYDFVLLDSEHGSLSLETIANHVRAARANNLGTLIRVPAGDASYIQRALDVGVEGVEVPHVTSADDARWAVSAIRFPPEGNRGMYTKGVVANYGLHGYSSVRELTTAVNAEVVCNIIIEDAEGVENIDEIVAVPGIDFVSVGPGDLSGSLNVIGQPDHPALRSAIEKVLAACRKANIPTHISASAAPRSAEELRAAGIWMLTSDTDAASLLHGMQADIANLPKSSSS